MITGLPSFPTHRPAVWLVALLLSPLLFTAPVRAVEPAVLIDTQLQSRPIQFVTLTAGEISYFDAQRQLQRASTANLVALSIDDRIPPAIRPAADPTTPAVLLHDGHVLTGSFAGTKDGKLLWASPFIGNVEIALDHVVQLRLNPPPSPPSDDDTNDDSDPNPPEPAPAAAPQAGTERSAVPGTPAPVIPQDAQDHVLLLNGDRISGFIASIDSAGLSIEVGPQKLPVAWDRLALIALPNPVNPTPGVWATLLDGTRLHITEPALDGRSLTGRTMGKDVQIDADSVARIDFATHHRLVRLGDLTPTIVSGGHVFGVAMPPIFDGPAAMLHAPITLAFDLPPGSLRFAATASLNPADLDWADLTLTIADGQGDLASHRLHRDQPSIKLNLQPRDTRLTLRLDDGINGPIRDRLTLRAAAVLVQQP
jgi:hypothetical protein